ncbi:9201_t:CDS:10 [Diversispora eburnea]|uniref:9201_t:CDS:1 n=1 Tax=Diversispora eburnea TaxID=1213867 RepID=A0A9N8ZM38_9GLOM|nr:9201_t:CDS:10 [Diversispora eburnea]
MNADNPNATPPRKRGPSKPKSNKQNNPNKVRFDNSSNEPKDSSTAQSNSNNSSNKNDNAKDVASHTDGSQNQNKEMPISKNSRRKRNRKNKSDQQTTMSHAQSSSSNIQHNQKQQNISNSSFPLSKRQIEEKFSDTDEKSTTEPMDIDPPLEPTDIPEQDNGEKQLSKQKWESDEEDNEKDNEEEHESDKEDDEEQEFDYDSLAEQDNDEEQRLEEEDKQILKNETLNEPNKPDYSRGSKTKESGNDRKKGKEIKNHESESQDSFPKGENDDSSSKNPTMVDKIKNLVKPRDDDILIKFYVHLPPFIHHSCNVFVAGNIYELGNWENLNVKLVPIKDDENKSTDFYESNTVRIPLARIPNYEIEYKYVLTPKTGKKKKNRRYEGNDNRVLEISGGNQYDVWCDTSQHYFDHPPDNNMFIKIIYKSVTEKNLKDKIMEYERIERSLRLQVPINLVNDLLFDSHLLASKLFLCVLLGYVLKGKGLMYSLPQEFQSVPLLEALHQIKDDIIPSETRKILSLTIVPLIRCNIMSESFEWLKVFAVADLLDPDYNFISSITEQNYGVNMEQFKKKLQELVIPYIDQINDDKIYVEIAKGLLKQVNNVNIIIEIWELLAHNEERDDHLRKFFKERVQKIVRSYESIIVLRDNFLEIPEHFKELISDAFKGQVFYFLNQHRNMDMPSTHSKAIYDMILNKQISWTKTNYIGVLDIISTYSDFEILTKFNNFLEFWTKVFNDDHENLPKICKQWYQKLLDRGSTFTLKKDKYVFLVLNHVSLVHPYIGKLNVWNDLLDMAIGSVKKWSVNSIFEITDKVEKRLVPRIGTEFGLMVKEILNPLNQINEQLLNTVKRILTPYIEPPSEGVIQSTELHVPGSLCENILCHIMTCTQKSFHDEFSSDFHRSLLEKAKFWIVLLRLKGSVKKFQVHPHITEIREAIFDLAEKIVEKNIDIHLLQTLLRYDDNFLFDYFDSAVFVNDLSSIVITKYDLKKVRKEFQNYEETLDIFYSFYVKFCSIPKVTDVNEYIDDIRQRHDRKSQIKLKDVLSADNWLKHSNNETIAKNIYKFRDSKTFKNTFEDISNKRIVQDTLTVNEISSTIIPQIYVEYLEKNRKYEEWEDLKFSEAYITWNNVRDVEYELSLMGLQREISPELVEILTHLSKVSQSIERLEQLLKLVEIFQIPLKEDDIWLKNSYDSLKHESLSLGKLKEFFDTLKYRLEDIDNETGWKLTKEISICSEFIAFLRQIVDEDLTNLINGVDDTEGRLIQEDTVSSLIQVKQILVPLINRGDKIGLKNFLLDFGFISKNNKVLAEKISLCNSNNMALQNMYNNISKRGEVTKEKITNAIKIGTYNFAWTSEDNACTVNLSYPSGGDTMNISFSELQDLRGRSLLIAKPKVSIDQNEFEEQESFELIINKFVEQIDTVLEIVDLSSKLIEQGHFSYRKFEESIQGTPAMKQQAQKLKKEIKDWDQAVNSAQDKHYYLTFFPARHILKFYDFFDNSANESCVNICRTLVKYVNFKANLPHINNSSRINSRKGEYFRILSEIGKRLHGILSSLPKDQFKLESIDERVVTDIVESKSLFIAACYDKSLVPNVIMSLYLNHGTLPNAWQLLICTSSTTSEEISIFIKRCFMAEKNGYIHHLFCMANVEVLDFKLQYDLVKKIRDYMERYKQSNFFLALICCPEKGVHHHILDQFSDFCVTKGLSNDAMKEIYKEICYDTICVTSSLSGQGKTEFIKQESFKELKIPRNFLISDGDDFGKLVRKFNKFPINREIDSLHINIISADNCEDVNMFLFQLLTFGIVSHKGITAILPGIKIYIEIASNNDQKLIKSLKFLTCLEIIHLPWNTNKLMISCELNSPIQVVCQYLKVFDSQTLDEKDVLFRSSNSRVTKNLASRECRRLLKKYFFDLIDPELNSFRFLEIFINVLSDQLVRLSASSFFRVENLKLMIHENDIRSTLMKTLMEVWTISHWDDSNHLLVFFLSQVPDSICALYRDSSKVPENVQKLLQSQHIRNDINEWRLEDYRTMGSEALLSKLECLARETEHPINYPPYALSADNLLKMALILLRTRANVPVIICGEAGCGKTSLIGFLAKMVEVDFFALNLHAGITEEIINKFMDDSLVNVNKREIWLFFDEINTCNHIGIFADLIAHRIYLGKPLHPNIRVFAACNPYRKRIKSSSEAGLDLRYEFHRSNLVYEVKPLPDQILDYVWDYGILQESDEKKYIDIMVRSELRGDLYNPIVAEILFASQQFIRRVEEPFSVSLRDVKRAITLIKFFYNSFNDRKLYETPSTYSLSIRSYVLAIGLSYQSRLYTQELRTEFRKEMSKILNIPERAFKTIISKEQNDYIGRMQLPPNTAKNEALLENVLIMIVCILTKIPVFIVGRPGTSKSMAIRLISNNLRGSDSNDKYFKKLPQVLLIPHQGSSSSTSDGILKVFDKANNYQKTSSDEFPVISVVLLDEVGLAETSPYNPLKVLHSLLEPSYPAGGPTVSVVGISNWRLDNNEDDLVDIAFRLLEKDGDAPQKSSLRPLAKAYSNYEQNGQKFKNFHGLRDYYSLVKSLSTKELTPENIQMALARNFGGTGHQKELCEDYFNSVIDMFNENQSWSYYQVPVKDLINANLEDDNARHLMIIGNSSSIVNLLTYQLRAVGLEPVVIFGSQFPNDRDDYSYTVLSRIMMCVEAGRPLILTDLEIIYGSLYDLWNQNYIIAGSKEDPKYYTRVALGAYANPMLSVAKNFRCILVMDEAKLPYADPPLLNRFEKQKMTMNDILTTDERNLVDELYKWAEQMATYPTQNMFTPSHKKFTLNDLFIGFNHDETVQSLVIDVKKNYPHLDDEGIIDKCKEYLILIATSDGMVRAEKSLEIEEIQRWKDVYFNEQKHDNLADYFKDLLKSEDEGVQVIVNTFSNINTDIRACLKGVLPCFIIKLSTFKTEAEFSTQINQFWFNSSKHEMVVLQCDITTVNSECIKLAKFIIEQSRHEYYTKRHEEGFIEKHACIILHMHRDQKSFMGFNFICGWNQITIEALAEQPKPLSRLLSGDLGEIIENIYPFEEILDQELLWCLSCIKYPSTISSLNHVKTIDSLREIRTFHGWQYDVASDKKYLYPYSSFSVALSAHIRTLVRQPISKLLCALENLSATQTFLNLSDPQQIITTQSNKLEQLLGFWRQMFLDKDIISIKDIPDPKTDGYLLKSGIYKLNFPFSYYFMKQIDSFKRLYEEELTKLREDPDNVDPDNGTIYGFENFIAKFSNNILILLQNYQSSPIETNRELYFKDFISVTCSNEADGKYGHILSFIFRKLLGPDKILNPILLHIFWWDNSNIILSLYHLAKMSKNISDLIIQTDDSSLENFNLSEYFVKDICDNLLWDIENIKENMNISAWQFEATKALSLCEKIPGSSSILSHLLQICRDLVLSNTPLLKIQEIIKIARKNNKNNQISIPFIKTVSKALEHNHASKRLFISKCLDIIDINTINRGELYKDIFLNEPFPLMSIIILRIFELEDLENENIFFQLFNNANHTFLLRIINDCLGNQGLDSRMAALCCDVIQKRFFAKATLENLSNYLRRACENIYGNCRFPLLRLISIALLKEFVHKFWDYTIQDEDIFEPIDIDSMQTDDFDMFIIISQLSSCLEKSSPLVHSLLIYFLRDLRQRDGFSIENVKKFCQAQRYILPWFNNLSWDDSQGNRFPFNPYWSLGSEYETLENSFQPLLSFNNRQPFNSEFFKNFKKNSKWHHIALVGLMINRLHAIRASREWSESETLAAEFLLEKVKSVNFLSVAYKDTITKIVKNEHEFLRIHQDTSTQDLLIKSVIGHVIALHASVPSTSSPLAHLLQNLHYCTGNYILSCSSNLEALLLNAIGEKLTRYRCSCGFMYVIGNCGFANGRGKCPQCQNVIGGENHVAVAGQIKLDTDPQNRVKTKDLSGYIGEAINEEKNESVRSMNPSSYRILHLFVHAIIGSWAPAPIAFNFLRKNNETATNVEKYCMDHIKNDWNILRTILNTSNENLALLLHSILNLLSTKPPKESSLDSPSARETWESYFMNEYVAPQIKNVNDTAMNFRILIDNAAKKSEGSNNVIEKEINQTSQMDGGYKKTHLPNLWRTIGDTSFESLRAQYLSDNKNNTKYPFMKIFFEQSENLGLIKHLHPIVKFVQLLSSKLEYRLNREKAIIQTFREFIEDESNEDSDLLDLAFQDFAKAWNLVIGHVKTYQCHDLPPQDKPKIKYDSPIVFGLIEPKDSGIYICAILEYLINLQNRFIQEVIDIPSGTSLSLKFMDEVPFEKMDTITSQSTSTAATPTFHHYTKSIQIIYAKPENLINYEWNDELLQYSQRNLDHGRGNEIFYDLQEIEGELAYQLVHEKVHINTLNDSQLYIEPFHFHMELFKGYMRILSEIKNLIPQQSIPPNIISAIMGLASNTSQHMSRQYDTETLPFDNASELLTCLEILLCFVKRTPTGNGKIYIREYVKKWMNLSTLEGNNLFMNLLKLELRLEHVVALYELVEEHVANGIIKYIDDKYKEELDDDQQEEINKALNYDLNNSKNMTKIPAQVFVAAMKRFMLRFLSTESIKEDYPLNVYFNDESLNLWPSFVSEQLVEECFPDSLLVSNVFWAYKFVDDKLEELKKQQQLAAANAPRKQPQIREFNNQLNNSRDSHSPSKESSNSGSSSSRGHRRRRNNKTKKFDST